MEAHGKFRGKFVKYHIVRAFARFRKKWESYESIPLVALPWKHYAEAAKYSTLQTTVTAPSTLKVRSM